MRNLYDAQPAADAQPQSWCGGNLGGDNETCVTTVPLAGVPDAYVVGDSKPEGRGAELRMTGAELDIFAIKWARSRGLEL